MKTQMAQLCLFSMITSVSFIAGAHCGAHCIEDDWIPLSSQIKVVGACRAGAELALVRQEIDLPNMSHNPYDVEVWQGSYLRDQVTTTSYLHRVIDRCSWRNHVVLSKKEAFSETETIEFKIENPNTTTAVQATQDLVPMTDKEAAGALAAALKTCVVYKP